MKTLYIDCGMGAAGDMLTGALLELFPDKEAICEQLNDLQIPGVRYEISRAEKCGITGTHVTVRVHGEVEGEHDHHGHDHHSHEHGHHVHTHTGMHAIEHLVWDLHLPDKVEKDVLSVYRILAEAESRAHGVPVPEIHFHEVGTMDAVADITAVCYLLDLLSPDEIAASPVHTGCGEVHCAHGILPVPAPATANILKGIPIYSDGTRGELTTPTGAALLKHFVRRFGPMPAITTEAIGYGMGTKDFEKANCVRILYGSVSESAPAVEAREEPEACASTTGEKEAEAHNGLKDRVCELSCNIDDMTGEEIGFAVERLLEEGALDVYTIPIGMKKNRPGIMICVLCREQDKERMSREIFRYTSTLGIRETTAVRSILHRTSETVSTPCGEVRIKKGYGYDVGKEKAEYEDLARLAREQGVSLREILKKLTTSAEYMIY